jgi:gluconokinase
VTIRVAAQPRIIVMGPSGCGKTTIARALARSLHAHFLEGDELHSAANVEKMRSGVALDDSDRAPWLDALGSALCAQAGQAVVATCSALKRQYRDRLRADAGPLVFIQPVVPREVLARRLLARTGHYMPVSLLDSQLAELEPLASDEPGFQLPDGENLDSKIGIIRSRLGL